jgi:hypothetical protein
MAFSSVHSGLITAEAKYRAIREVVYKLTAGPYPELVVGPISRIDVFTADQWKEFASESARKKRSSWSWANEFTAYQRIPDRFEVSVKSGQMLGALCYGQPSRAGSRLRLNLIESTPVRPTPLGMRAFPVIALTAASYAEAIGATELWILDPDPNIEGLYMQEGFGGRTYYHGKRVGQRRIL